MVGIILRVAYITVPNIGMQTKQNNAKPNNLQDVSSSCELQDVSSSCEEELISDDCSKRSHQALNWREDGH